MAILFNVVAFDGSISGTSDVYSSAELNSVLAQAEKYFVSSRVGQASAGAGSPTITVAIEHSNDGVNWTTKSTPISAETLSTSAITLDYGADTGTTVGGAGVRVKITLAGTTPAANVQIRVCGRSND